MKFLLDNERSVDLVAMESLAGQGKNQNYFFHEFSPDFSKRAPLPYNTETDPEGVKYITERYNSNRVNHEVMKLVGKRFAQVIPYVTNYTKEEVEASAHSVKGPNPFIISIDDLARFNSNGQEVPKIQRPWRLVFKPSLENIKDQDRKNAIVSDTSYTIGSYEKDFRYKLGHLQPGDQVYHVLAESESGVRYLIGDITLTSAALPSSFADNIYFVQHKLDGARITGEGIVDL